MGWRKQILAWVVIPIFNIHASDLPRYPGLGTIYQCIKEKEWEQNVCLHHVDKGIDTGRVLLKRGYTLSPELSYRENENRAYNVAISVAMDFASNNLSELIN